MNVIGTLLLVVGLQWLQCLGTFGPETPLEVSDNYCDLIDATVALLGSQLSTSGLRNHIAPAMFEADGFLRILAHVETRDGENLATSQGGLWNVSTHRLTETVDSCAMDLAVLLNRDTIVFEIGEGKFSSGVDFTRLSKVDFDTPAISAIGALLILLCNELNYGMNATAITDADLNDLPGLYYKYQSRGLNEAEARAYFRARKESYEANPCTVACNKTTTADIIVLMDSSGSIGRSDFTKALNYTAELSLLYELGENDTRFGVIFYHSDVEHTLAIPLNYTYNHSVLINRIKETGYTRGGTSTGHAIEYATQQFFNEGFGSRRSDVNDSSVVPLVLIVATDGQSSDDVTQPSNSAREKDINIFSIGIGPNVNDEELRDIAGQESRVFRTANYDELTQIALIIQSATCKAQVTVIEGTNIHFTLSSSEVVYFKLAVPLQNCDNKSLRLHFNSRKGSTTVYGSFQYQNPTARLHHFKWTIERDDESSHYVLNSNNETPHNCGSNRKRRQVTQEAQKTLYLGVSVDSEEVDINISSTIEEVPEEAQLQLNVRQAESSSPNIISYICTITCDCPTATITWVGGTLVTNSANDVYSSNSSVATLLLNTSRSGYEGEYVCIIESQMVIGTVRSGTVHVPLRCENNGTSASLYRCMCPSGWTGRACEQFKCDPKCENNGTCIGPNRCSCTYGWGGDDCTQPVCDPSCLHGVCSSPYHCNCSSGYWGNACDIPVCEPRCINAVCVSPNICKCVPGWKGRNCSQFYCMSPCENNGTCVGPNNCSCVRGWSGPSCTDPHCQPSCKNGGSCMSLHCHCHPGWFGQSCEIAYCPDSCNNGGRCVSPGVCQCGSGWMGANCSTAVCSEECKNGGTCDQPNHCHCLSGWSGPTCEQAVESVQSVPAAAVPAAAVAAGVIIPLLLIAGMVLVAVGVVLAVRWRSKRGASYDPNTAKPKVSYTLKSKRKISGGVVYNDIAAVTISPSTENLFDPVPEENEEEVEGINPFSPPGDLGSGGV